MATIPVKDANNVTVDLEKPLAPGRAVAASSRPVALANEDFAVLGAIVDAVEAISGVSGTPGRAAAAASSPVVISTEDLAALSQPTSGRAAAASSKPVVISTEDLAALVAVSNVTIAGSLFSEYETVAASQTNQALGATGATADYLAGILIIPATTSPGAVTIKDGAGSAITIFAGGSSSVSNLVPFFVPLGIKSGAGAWQVTTGTNVSAIGVGNFT